jgi:peptide/nickel transport system permease protein
MLRYVLRRLLYAVPILIGVTLVTFVVFYASASPRSIAKKNLSARNPTEEQIQAWLRDHGYDRPLQEQALRHVSEILLLRFGKSDQSKEDIWGRIRLGVGPSVQVAGVVFVSALFASLTLAVLVAYFRGTYVDGWGTFLCVIGMSIVYMVYIIGGQYLLGKTYKWHPIAGWDVGLDSWKFVWLPAAVGIVSGIGANVRLYRTFLLDEMNQDYVRTARAKGVAERVVLFRHVLKNAAIPILTNVVTVIPLLLTGSLLLESFFSIPGLGSYLVDAINSQDFAVVRAMVALGTLLYIAGTLLTDLGYALVDPRVRLE